MTIEHTILLVFSFFLTVIICMLINIFVVLRDIKRAVTPDILKVINDFKSYVIAHITNKDVTKNERYPIVTVTDDIVVIDVNGKLVEIEKYDGNFSFFINKRGQ